MKRLMLSSHCLVVYCLVLSLFAGMGYADSQAATTDGTTVIMHALEQADAVRNPANRVVALSRIAGTYLQKGYYNQALSAAEKITEPYARSLLLLELARLSTNQGPSVWWKKPWRVSTVSTTPGSRSLPG